MPTEIYVHIPFCVRKCAYCDFLSFPAGSSLQRRYVDALLREIRQTETEKSRNADLSQCDYTELQRRGSLENKVGSIFIGGGTPSLLPAEWIAEILQATREAFDVAEDAEITIEANPGTVNAEKLHIYREAGINRVSFGCQSFHDEELRILGRIHSVREIKESVKLARDAGFKNINLDLMSGLPGQDLQTWEDTLRQAIELQPEHISAYSLILEEGTPFYEIYGEHEQSEKTHEDCSDDLSGNNQQVEDQNSYGTDKMFEADSRMSHCADKKKYVLPDEETERQMYERTAEILAEAGYRQYEISNYAKEGYACRHNLGYWTGVPYYGFGLGASGYLPQNTDKGSGITKKRSHCHWIRYRNTCGLTAYLSGCGEYDEIQELSTTDMQAEFMILGLRLTEGVEEEEFTRRFGRTLDSIYGPVLEKYEKMGLMARKDGRIYLTREGISVSNRILAEFL